MKGMEEARQRKGATNIKGRSLDGRDAEEDAERVSGRIIFIMEGMEIWVKGRSRGGGRGVGVHNSGFHGSDETAIEQLSIKYLLGGCVS